MIFLNPLHSETTNGPKHLSPTKRFVTLNARGFRFIIQVKILEKFPTSRLAKLKLLIESNCQNESEYLKLCDFVSLKYDEFYFNEDPFIFNQILNIYSSNQKLHFNEGVCYKYIIYQLRYWRIDESQLDSCCRLQLQKKKDIIQCELMSEEHIKRQIEINHDFGKRCLPKLREKLWYFIEKPNYSYGGLIYLFTSLFIVLTSVFLLIFKTVPNINVNQEYYVFLQNFKYVFLVWSTFDFLIRLFATPNLNVFISSLSNWIDFFITLSIYVQIFLIDYEIYHKFLEYTIIFRIFYLFRLTKSSLSLQALTDTLYYSKMELLSYLFYLKLAVLVFSSLCYIAESHDENTAFTSIPASIWWAIATVTTVGYGDIYPKTIAGKIIGSAFAITSIIIVAMPISLISNNYLKFYELNLKKVQIEKSQQRLKKETKLNSYTVRF